MTPRSINNMRLWQNDAALGGDVLDGEFVANAVIRALTMQKS
jgi:hypothetical protein